MNERNRDSNPTEQGGTDANAARRSNAGHRGITTFSSHDRDQPPGLRWFNRLGRPLRRLVSLSPDRLIAAARKQAGDAGDQPLAFEGPLRTLLDSLRYESDLHLAGRIAAYQDTLRLVRTQLRMSAAFEAEPEIADIELPQPVFVTGMPRTGTTLLLSLLVQDPDHRCLKYWEGFDPLPSRGGPEEQERRTANMLRGLDYTSPGYQAIHPMQADSPEECVMLFMHTFTTPQLDIQYHVPSYMNWLDGVDRRASYEHYRHQLQLIHRRRPMGKRMILKDPSHMFSLDVILDVFPGARIVHIHRDPLVAVPSNCSLYAHTRAIFLRNIDTKALGEHVLYGTWPDILDHSLALRERIDTDRIVDVAYADLMREPLETMSRLYESLDLELSSGACERMAGWLNANPQDKHGVHGYSLGQFGLSHDQVEERFADYRRRFDVAIE